MTTSSDPRTIGARVRHRPGDADPPRPDARDPDGSDLDTVPFDDLATVVLTGLLLLAASVSLYVAGAVADSPSLCGGAPCPDPVADGVHLGLLGAIVLLVVVTTVRTVCARRSGRRMWVRPAAALGVLALAFLVRDMLGVTLAY